MTMGRPSEYGERVTKSLRVSRDLDARLRSAARERGIGANVLVNLALEDYLKRLIPLDALTRTAAPSDRYDEDDPRQWQGR
jgi:hypothetical protein